MASTVNLAAVCRRWRGLGCPYEGHVAPQRVAQVAQRLLEARSACSGKMWDVKFSRAFLGELAIKLVFVFRQFG